MADEEKEQAAADNQAEGAEANTEVEGGEEQEETQTETKPVAAVEEATEEDDATGVSVLGLVCIAAIAMGVYSLIGDDPSLVVLGAGLIGFGIIDLVNSLKEKKPAGQKTWGLVLTLLRSMWLILFGGYAILTGFSAFEYPGFGTFLMAWAVFAVIYLCLAMLAELLSKDKVEVGPVLLMGALMLMGLSFFFFSVQFHLTFAGTLALLSLVCAGFALWRGALDSNRSLGLTMLAALLVMVAPFTAFTIQHMTEETHPVLGWHNLVGQEHLEQLGKQAKDLKWAPAFKNSSQDAIMRLETRQSSKLEFAYMKQGKRYLFIYNENRNNPDYDRQHTEGRVKIFNLHPEAEGFWWSPDSSRLAFTHYDKIAGARALAVADERTERLASIAGEEAHPEEDQHDPEQEYEKVNYRKMNSPDVVSDKRVWPMVADHGQIWSRDSHEILYAAPVGDKREYLDNIKEGATKIWKANLKTQRVVPLTSGNSKVYPAWAPDESRIAFVTFKPGVVFLQMSEGDGSRPREFKWRREKRYFPAWNQNQDKVLYVKDGELILMDANGTNGRPFTTKAAKADRVWFTAEKEKFLLEFVGIPDKWQIKDMDPDGRKPRVLYETECDEIYPPVWSPDSKRIAFVQRSNDKEFSIYNMGRDGDREGDWAFRFFTSQDRIREIRWSPESNKLAFFVDRREEPIQELWTVTYDTQDRDQKDPQKIYEGEVHMRALSWSKDQQYLAFEERSQWTVLGLRMVHKDLFRVKVADLDHDKVRPVLPFSAFGRQPAFSPSGTLLAFVSDANRFMPDKNAAILVARFQ